MSQYCWQAIETRYYGATNYKGSRIKAWCDAKTRWFSYDHGLDLSDNHKWAAEQLAEELGWAGEWCMGALPNGDYCFAGKRCDEGQPNFVIKDKD